MYTSPETDLRRDERENGNNENTGRTGTAGSAAAAYATIALFCAIFGFVYECFSHGVRSAFMIFAFAVPLAAAGFCFAIKKLHRPAAGTITRNALGSAVAALTLGSLVRGALDIYGTYSPYVVIYLIAGAILAAAVAVGRVIDCKKKA